MNLVSLLAHERRLLQLRVSAADGSVLTRLVTAISER
jgi:hypothetical protein